MRAGLSRIVQVSALGAESAARTPFLATQRDADDSLLAMNPHARVAQPSLVSIALFLLASACWLPVVWLQMRMRDLAVAAAAQNAPLPPQFTSYFRIWTGSAFRRSSRS